MQEAAEAAERTVLVLSPDYLNSKMAAPEWAAAFAKDPQGLDRRIVPVMVKNCQPGGLLPQIVQIRIFDLGEEAARTTLIAGVDSKRAKPSARPAFPGTAAEKAEHKDFLGQPTTPTVRRASIISTLQNRPTELQIRKFVKDGFATIRECFVSNLDAAARENGRIDTDFTDVTGTEFRAELFVDGESKCVCRVFLGQMFGPNTICYGQWRSSGNSASEILSPAKDGSLAFSAMMSMGFTQFERDVDVKRMTADQAADYFWSRFIAPLAHR
jgi:hypothetical protein